MTPVLMTFAKRCIQEICLEEISECILSRALPSIALFVTIHIFYQVPKWMRFVTQAHVLSRCRQRILSHKRTAYLFLLLYKRLKDVRFNWPRNEQKVRNLTHEQFDWLMQGLSIDQPKAIKQVEGGVDTCWVFQSASNIVDGNSTILMRSFS